MDYLNADRTGPPIQVPVSDRLSLPGQWVPVVCDHKISDNAGHLNTAAGTFCNGSRYCHGKLLLRLQDFEVATEIQIRTFEIDTTGQRVETHEPDEFYTAAVPPPADEAGNELYPRTTHHHFEVVSNVNSGHRLGVEISQWPHDLSAPLGQIVKAQIVLNMWAP